MNNKGSNTRNNISRSIPLIFIGIGLVIIGFVAIALLTNGQNTNEYSVIPSEVNFPAPELTLNDLSGGKVSITDYRQQVVLINNWATWCPPCKLEMPVLEKYFREHTEQGFILIGIEAGDPVDEVTSFINKYNLTFPILLDPNNKSMLAFHNDNLPSSYVINHNGNVVLAWTGPISHTMLEKYVTPLLEQ